MSMATPLYLKPDNFGTFDYTYVPSGGICPPGQQGSAMDCLIAPCPDVCVASESMVLSGEALAPNLPATLEDVARQQAAEQGGSPPWLSIAAVAISILGLLGAKGMAR